MNSAVNSPATAILEEPVSTRNSICNKGTKFIATFTINWHRRLNVFTHCIFKSDHERNPLHLSFHRVDAYLNICPLLKGCRISRIQMTNLRKNNGKS